MSRTVRQHGPDTTLVTAIAGALHGFPDTHSGRRFAARSVLALLLPDSDDESEDLTCGEWIEFLDAASSLVIADAERMRRRMATSWGAALPDPPPEAISWDEAPHPAEVPDPPPAEDVEPLAASQEDEPEGREPVAVWSASEGLGDRWRREDVYIYEWPDSGRDLTFIPFWQD